MTRIDGEKVGDTIVAMLTIGAVMCVLVAAVLLARAL